MKIRIFVLFLLLSSISDIFLNFIICFGTFSFPVRHFTFSFVKFFPQFTLPILSHQCFDVSIRYQFSEFFFCLMFFYLCFRFLDDFHSTFRAYWWFFVVLFWFILPLLLFCDISVIADCVSFISSDDYGLVWQSWFCYWFCLIHFFFVLILSNFRKPNFFRFVSFLLSADSSIVCYSHVKSLKRVDLCFRRSTCFQGLLQGLLFMY